MSNRSRPLARLASIALCAVVLASCQFLGGAPSRTYPPTTVRSVAIPSKLLNGDRHALVYVPGASAAADTAEPLPLLLVFHGFGADESSWFGARADDALHLDGEAEALIASGTICPVAIASIDIDDSYGVDSEPATDQFDHGPYEQYVLEEAIPAVEAALTASAPGEGSPSPTARRELVAGYSMGGFAALHLAFRHPRRFSAVGALSPAAFIDTPRDRQWLFNGDGDANDPMRLARTADLDGVRVFLGNGDRDYGWIRDGTEELARRLTDRGLEVRPTVVAGGHDAGTWRQLEEPMLRALLAPPCDVSTP